MELKSALFLHIQKTAGTTIVDLVRPFYGSENVASHGDFITSWAGEDLELISYPSDKFQDFAFISGHFGFDFAKQLMAGRYSFTFLRDPIERILSFYYFCRTRDPEEFEVYALSQKVSLDEFLALGLAHQGVKGCIWNNQAWQLAYGYGHVIDTDRNSYEPDEILKLAIQHMDEFSHIGFAETFESDRDKILKDLGIKPPSRRVVSNSNLSRPRVSDLPKSTRDLLHELTHLDRQLYREAWSRRDGSLKKYTSILRKTLGDRAQTHQNEIEQARNHYLELLQPCLTGSIYRDASQAPFGSPNFDSQMREHGLDWPMHAQTMIGDKRLANLRMLTESVLADNVPGDFIETGVWRGGACILMRAVLYAYGETSRKVWVADSFEGLPPANELQYPADAGSDFHTYKELAVSLAEVQENFRSYGLLDEQTVFLIGWFKDTLPVASIEQLALMRLDGDMYESTMDALTSLYPKLSQNGYVIIDDYHVVPACEAAVRDYCLANGIVAELVEIDGVGVYWKKKEPAKFSEKITQQAQKIWSSDDLLVHLKQAISDLNQMIALRLLQSLSERDADVAKLNSALLSRDDIVAKHIAEIAGLHADLLERDDAIAKHVAEIVELNTALLEKDGAITKLGGEVGRLNQTLAGLYSSTSWRVTKPLRAVKNIFTGNFRNKAQEYSSNINVIIKNPSSEVSANLFWKDDTHLTINDVDFHLSYDTEQLRTNTIKDSFLLGKPRHLVDKSVEISKKNNIKKIFEMGILQGGSVVLYDQIFHPEKIVAIDHEPKPVVALEAYIKKHNKHNVIKPKYGINQAEYISMKKILSAEFPERDIGLIIDDASHLYKESRDAFNISFPYLKNGGLYVIEDWAWAHWAGDYWQKNENPALAGKDSLSNLLIELFMLAASRPDFIEDIFIDHNVIIVKKGMGLLPPGKFNIAEHYLLRGKHFGAWL